MKENILSEKWYTWEYIDDEGNYIKTKYCEVESFHFYLRFLGEHFHPCPECQKKLKEIKEKGNMILGNKAYEPPVEFTYSFAIDDNSWEPMEKRKATKKDEKTLGRDGIRTEI